MDLLLRAAEYLDKKEKESLDQLVEDHGYASSSPKRFTRMNVKLSSRSSRSKYSSERNLHNELEKSRRANLRYSLEKLKEVIPSESGPSKFTTLQLLLAATVHIKKLEKDQLFYKTQKNGLKCRQKELQNKLQTHRSARIRSSMSDSDDIDVVDCNSEASDDNSRLSISSYGSLGSSSISDSL